MELFSERNGLIKTKDDCFSSSFRNAIINSFFNQYANAVDDVKLKYLREVMDLFGITQEPHLNVTSTLRQNQENTLVYFQKCEWNDIFDFIEYALEIDPQRADKLEEKYNQIFRKHGIKYRLLNGRVVPIVTDIEIEEMSKALHTGESSTDIAYAEAIKLLSEKKNPDYGAVIAKASNALESMVLAVARDNDVSDDTLGKAINKLEDKGVVFDKDMKTIIKSIYTFASNAGIRHGGTEPTIATEEDAILVMVICAAAINYLNSLRVGNGI